MGIDDKQIPSYLQGQIYDVQADPNGGISFQHPAANPGFNSQSMGRIHLDPEQAKATFDQNYRLLNQQDALEHQYMPPRRVPMGERMERGIAGWLKQKGSELTGSTGKNIATAGLLSALAGGAGGAWMASNSGEPILDKAVLYALLAGSAGAGLSALNEYSGKKSLESGGLLKSASVSSAISSDPTLSGRQKDFLSSAVSQLPSKDRAELEQMLYKYGGAAVGVLVAKFLGLRGFVAPSVLAMLGFAIGSALSGGSQSYNSAGQPIIPYHE